MTEKLLRVSDVAGLLDVDEYRVYALARENLLPHVRLGRQLRFSADAINQFIQNGGKSWPGGWRKEA